MSNNYNEIKQKLLDMINKNAVKIYLGFLHENQNQV